MISIKTIQIKRKPFDHVVGIISIFMVLLSCSKTEPVRQSVILNDQWQTIASDSTGFDPGEFQSEQFKPENWLTVDVPHNWDDYAGYRRLRHGNFHGSAWYRKTFSVEKPLDEKRFFLFFEGVSSYATIWLNGDSVGYHAGGRTTFTIDVTDHLRFDRDNLLAVKAENPAFIHDLPWVCGGCSADLGFSEGSQPLGIFRPVQLIMTHPVRIEPFGIHIWNDDQISETKASLNVTAEIKNYSEVRRQIEVRQILRNQDGKKILSVTSSISIEPGSSDTLKQVLSEIKHPILWSPDQPYRYRLCTQVVEDGKLVDELITPYGIRTTKWDISGEGASNRFYINGNPFFINGVAEYEHLMGQSHAFTDEQIKARMGQFKAVGFNTFRDAHQPHNLRYIEYFDSLGILWWPQFSAHVWYDNPDFKTNFRQLMHDWIKERRNSPSIILWGLQNESILPDSFSVECTKLIRKLDPGSPSQRLVATCNGGTGADWEVPQNWSGTYGGTPSNYANELLFQKLNAEYGAYRSIDLHTEGELNIKGPLSEERICLLLEMKVRLAESVRDSICGHLQWPLITHDNPGRVQGGEGFRELDRVGPVNYKGIMTIWGEPTDLFYMYRSNYAPADKEPMVYIAMHTWPDRWTEPGLKDNIHVYSNCDEVELYNGLKTRLLGRKTRNGIGTHFIFNQADVQTNLLYAIGYRGGKAIASDAVVLNHLPADSGLDILAGKTQTLTASGRHYVYRVNCGGPDYTDQDGHIWQADVHQSSDTTWGSHSWADDYEGVPSFFASQRQTHDPIEGTLDWPLLQTFRYGKHKLNYRFPLPNGQYTVELYFIEPWYGTGGGMDCRNWRQFDVALNGNTVIHDLDIWAEAGHNRLLRKEARVEVTTGQLEIAFPKVKSGQAILSAIAISSDDSSVQPASPSPGLISGLMTENGKWEASAWMDTGCDQFTDAPGKYVTLAPVLYGAEWLKTPEKWTVSGPVPASFVSRLDADLFVGIDTQITKLPDWLATFEAQNETIVSTYKGRTTYRLYKKRINKDAQIELKPLGISNPTMAYPVALVPVSSLDDIIDLRQGIDYQSEDGKLWGTGRVTEYMGKKCVILPDEKGSYGLVFKVGLASKYGFEIRFMNCSGGELPAHVVILSDDKRIMWEGDWSFRTADVKWQSMLSNTQTIINAGTYTMKITPKKKGPLYFDRIKVQ